jgi:hypothetical protein
MMSIAVSIPSRWPQMGPHYGALLGIPPPMERSEMDQATPTPWIIPPICPFRGYSHPKDSPGMHTAYHRLYTLYTGIGRGHGMLHAAYGVAPGYPGYDQL